MNAGTTEMEGVSSSPLQADAVAKGLKTLGMHPLFLRHAFLELCATDMQVDDISVLGTYVNLMYIDVSRNKISSLSVLESIPALVQLRARGNQLSSCLDFAPAWCNGETSWASGNQAVGSMLTLADLRDNNISLLRDLSDHYYLECLLLGNNQISAIAGLRKLRYLQTLDLSNNRISVIEGLDDLPIRELNLSHNNIVSVDGLVRLPCLSALNVSHNKVVTLAPLRTISTLTLVDASHNHVAYIRQVEFLSELPWLQALSLHHNDCFGKPHFRLRVIFRLALLQQLDGIAVSREERVRAHNLYHSLGGDLQLRERAFAELCPKFEFQDHSPAQLAVDEEMELTLEQLAADPGADVAELPVEPVAEEAATDIIADLPEDSLALMETQ